MTLAGQAETALLYTSWSVGLNDNARAAAVVDALVKDVGAIADALAKQQVDAPVQEVDARVDAVAEEDEYALASHTALAYRWTPKHLAWMTTTT